MKIQSMLLLFTLVGVLLASSLNEDNSEKALLQEDDLKGGKAAFFAKLAALKTSASEDEAPFWSELWNKAKELVG